MKPIFGLSWQACSMIKLADASPHTMWTIQWPLTHGAKYLSVYYNNQQGVKLEDTIIDIPKSYFHQQQACLWFACRPESPKLSKMIIRTTLSHSQIQSLLHNLSWKTWEKGWHHHHQTSSFQILHIHTFIHSGVYTGHKQVTSSCHEITYCKILVLLPHIQAANKKP